MNDVTKDLLEALKNVADWIHGLPIPTTGATAKLKRIDAAIARAEASLSSSDDAPSSAEERRLRRMLCRQRHGLSAYMDDGEATFGGDEFQRPTDYLRESLDSIEQAWIEAGLKQAQAAPQPDADGWIPWAGGKCPVDSGEVKVKLRNGCECADIASKFRWSHTDGLGDIIAYRVVEAQP